MNICTKCNEWIIKGQICTDATLSQHENCKNPWPKSTHSAWERINTVMAEADKLEELTRLRMERPGETRESAFEWAKEMYKRYSPKRRLEASAGDNHGIGQADRLEAK